MVEQIEQLGHNFFEQLNKVFETDDQIHNEDFDEINKATEVYDLYFRTVTYKGQYFTIEWWATETGICWHLLCEGVTSEDINAIFEDSIYVITKQEISTEGEIPDSISKIMYAIKTYYLADNFSKIINLSKEMADAVSNMRGLPNANKYMLYSALDYYKLIE